MKKILRQTALGVGTFGTGCALLALSVNPYLLVLADTVVGVGMLFAAGSLSMEDLHPKKGEAAGEVPAGPARATPETPGGLRASLGRLAPSLGRKGKEEQAAHEKEIDQMLDTTLAAPGKRLISLAEGKRASPAAAAGEASAGTTAGGEDLLEQLSQAEIGSPFGEEEEEPGKAGGLPGQAPAAATPASLQEAGAPLPGLGEIGEAAARAGAAPEPEDIGADDLLSALRAEAMKEKRRDDTSLVRDLKGVKVTGKQLLEELGSLVKDMRRR
ncbi:MAG TPA: hypothetical protein VMT31_03495 [Methanomicrobiales archaeon]|nr:hypothetical protein [Methanomicrobiales archaeon]